MTLSAEDFKKKELEIYNRDKKEYLARMGIDLSNRISEINIHGISIDLNSNDSVEIVAMKVRNAIENKEFIEGEFTHSNQKLIGLTEK